MSTVALFELLAAICALLAAVVIFDQHVLRPRPYKLMWSLGLFFYAIAASAAFAGEMWGWSATIYATFYFFGGVLTAAFLGLGSFYLLGPRAVGHILAALAVLAGLYTAVRIGLYTAQADVASQIAGKSTADIAHITGVFPPDVRTITIVMNIAGSVFLFGGAIWSAVTFARQRASGSRLLSMIFIALGALFPATATGLEYGLQWLGYSNGGALSAALGEFLGALFLLLGLFVSVDAFTVVRVPFTPIVVYERRGAAEPARR
jgi:hypothetical protein